MNPLAQAHSRPAVPSLPAHPITTRPPRPPDTPLPRPTPTVPPTGGPILACGPPDGGIREVCPVGVEGSVGVDMGGGRLVSALSLSILRAGLSTLPPMLGF